MDEPPTTEARVAALLHVLRGTDKTFVLFAAGTVVVLTGPDRSDARARQVLQKELGLATPGGPKGDFNVTTLQSDLGWVVSYDHADVFTLILADEMGAGSPSHLIGLLARGRRDEDVEDAIVVHRETL